MMKDGGRLFSDENGLSDWVIYEQGLNLSGSR